MEHDGKSWKPQAIQDQRSHCRVASGCQMNSLESSFLEPSQVTSHQTLPRWLAVGFRFSAERWVTWYRAGHVFMFIILYMYIILYNCIWRTSIEKKCFTYQCMSLMLHSDAQPRTIVYWAILWTIVTWSSCDADPTHTNKSWSSHSPNLRASNWWKFPETSHALSKMSHMQVGPHAQIPWFGSQ